MQMETRKSEHMDLSILDENVPYAWIFDDFLSNVIKNSISFVFVSDNSVNTIYSFIY